MDVISNERFTTYLNASGGNADDALRLYAFNIAASGSLLGPLQTLEVALRNALHDRLCGQWGRTDWWSAPDINLTHVHQSMIREAIDRGGAAAAPAGKVVAELPFGFWVGLLGRGGRNRYEMRLWWPALRNAFPHFKGSRKDLHQDLDYLRTLRNRVAHHEPVFRRHLSADAASIERLVGYICPTTALWLQDHSRVNHVLSLRHDPESIIIF